jgi:hypothetical protein
MATITVVRNGCSFGKAPCQFQQLHCWKNLRHQEIASLEDGRFAACAIAMLATTSCYPPAAVDGEDGACDKRGFIRDEIQRVLGDIVWRAEVTGQGLELR